MPHLFDQVGRPSPYSVAVARCCLVGRLESGGVSNIQQISDESEGQYHDMDESQGMVCNEYRALKQEYESALREVELYESGGVASIQQSHRYEGEAKAVSDAAGCRLMAHSKNCEVCKAGGPPVNHQDTKFQHVSKIEQ
jgi:hypothetical protein